MNKQTTPASSNKLDALFTQIAQRHLNVDSLQTRNSDRLDFHDVSVWGIRSALEAAFEAGAQARASKAQEATD